MSARAMCIAAALLWAGCSNELSGNLEINGAPVKLTACRNGTVYGFRGVELTADNGIRVRVAATETGESSVVVMPSDAKIGVRIGTCGAFEVADQKSTINSVKNVEGSAAFDCKGDGFTLKGSAKFSNCH